MIDRLEGDPPSPWEGPFGFSRTVRAGPLVLIAGTTSVGPGGSIIGDSTYTQTVEILGKIVHELQRVGLSTADVVQTRIYTTDISRGEDIGRAHGEVFGDHRPVMTMVEITALIDPRMLVEVEAIAYAPER